MTFEAELGANPGPVDLEGGAALLAVSFATFEFFRPGAIEQWLALRKQQLSYAELREMRGMEGHTPTDIV